jgi:hypothetical protein
MKLTTTRIRVRVLTQPDGTAHLVNADTYQRLAIEVGPEAAEIHAAERGWYVVNPRPAAWDEAA